MRSLASKTKPWIVTLLIILSIAIAEIGTDIYLPAMPLLETVFSVSEEAISMTLSMYLMGICISGPIYGPLSDSYGRRPILIVGMSLFAFASMMCMLAADYNWLLTGRSFQGLGAGVTAVVGVAMIKDIYQDEKFSRMFSMIGMAIALAPAIGPILGAYLTHEFGWSFIFIFLAVAAVLILLAIILTLPETLDSKNKQVFHFRSIVKTYKALLGNKAFIFYAMISAIAFASLWGYIAIVPFHFIKNLQTGMMAYGYYQLALVISYMLGTYINNALVEGRGLRTMLWVGLIIMFLGGLLLTFFCGLWPESALLMTVGMGVYSVGMAIVFANATTLALDAAPTTTGSASALLNSIEMGLGSIAIIFIQILYTNHPLPIGLFVFISAVLCILVLSASKEIAKK